MSHLTRQSQREQNEAKPNARQEYSQKVKLHDVSLGSLEPCSIDPVTLKPLIVNSIRLPLPGVGGTLLKEQRHHNRDTEHEHNESQDSIPPAKPRPRVQKLCQARSRETSGNNGCREDSPRQRSVLEGRHVGNHNGHNVVETGRADPTQNFARGEHGHILARRNYHQAQTADGHSNDNPSHAAPLINELGHGDAQDAAYHECRRAGDGKQLMTGKVRHHVREETDNGGA